MVAHMLCTLCYNI